MSGCLLLLIWKYTQHLCTVKSYLSGTVHSSQAIGNAFTIMIVVENYCLLLLSNKHNFTLFSMVPPEYLPFKKLLFKTP